MYDFFSMFVEYKLVFFLRLLLLLLILLLFLVRTHMPSTAA